MVRGRYRPIEYHVHLHDGHDDSGHSETTKVITDGAKRKIFLQCERLRSIPIRTRYQPNTGIATFGDASDFFGHHDHDCRIGLAQFCQRDTCVRCRLLHSAVYLHAQDYTLFGTKTASLVGVTESRRCLWL